MCCHVFPPAHVFPSGLGNIPVIKMGGSPFPHGGAILDVGGCPVSGVAWGPTTGVDVDASIIGICSSTGTNILASSGKKPLQLMEGGKAWCFFLFQLDLPEVASDSESEKSNELPWSIGVLLSCFCRTASSFWRPVRLASSSVILKLPCANFSSAFWQQSHLAELSPLLVWHHPSSCHGGHYTTQPSCWTLRMLHPQFGELCLAKRFRRPFWPP